MKLSAQLFLTVLTMLTATSVHAQHADILLRSDGVKALVGGAVDLGAEEGGPFFNLDARVFEGVFINPAAPTPPFGYDFERDEPGFYSDTTVPVGQNLPAGAGVSLMLDPFSLGAGTDTTFYWDGSGAVDFQPLTTTQSGVAFTFAPMAPAPFATVDGTSFLDDHPLFGLSGGAADGVYLARMRLVVDGLEPSDPFYIAWLASSVLVDEETAEQLEGALEAYEQGGPEPIVGGVNFAFFEEAVDFANGIPEPSTALLATSACGALLARRKR
ncbi:hypothetical protein Pla108_20070 [Botrimarina colliarenosi]|uniref:PEP-CTERM protein-sorting domain-containing protein n=1 Tax=Botrimarina colliarenosi TaxID=2528001 RepID=A0A5C6AD06_9BACT|nr:hypothetical protein [Botrimarina colliarenosi]TWT97854.1 hypothetical protein Pla108_20070 [Botrimarina colliarenosi]